MKTRAAHPSMLSSVRSSATPRASSSAARTRRAHRAAWILGLGAVVGACSTSAQSSSGNPVALGSAECPGNGGSGGSAPNLVAQCDTFSDTSVWNDIGAPSFGSSPVADPSGANDAIEVTFTDPRSGFFQALGAKLKPNTRYTATIYAKRVSSSPAFYLGYYDGAQPVQQYSPLVTPGDSWARSAAFTFQTGASDAGAIAVVNANVDGASQGNVGVADLWGLKVEEGATATSFGGCADAPTGQGGQGPGAGRNFLLGWYMGPEADAPPVHEFLGYYPDFSIGGAYIGPGGENYHQAVDVNNDYPVVYATQTLEQDDYGVYDPDKAANGDYDAAYAQGFDSIASTGLHVYALRVNWEWAGNWFSHSPYCNAEYSADPNQNNKVHWWCRGDYNNPKISASTWVAAWKHFVDACRAHPQCKDWKIAWDYPLNLAPANVFDYYPGDDYVDLVTADTYLNKQYCADSSSCWSNVKSGQNGLDAMADFAKQHGKHMAFWEVGENYGDGVFWKSFGEWVKAHDVVAVSVWDDSTYGAKIQSTPEDLQSFVGEFGTPAQYTGTYWPTHFNVPSANPPAGF